MCVCYHTSRQTVSPSKARLRALRPSKYTSRFMPVTDTYASRGFFALTLSTPLTSVPFFSPARTLSCDKYREYIPPPDPPLPLPLPLPLPRSEPTDVFHLLSVECFAEAAFSA